MVAAFVGLLAFVGYAAAPAAGQSTNWTTQLLVPPFASSFVSEWERNPQNLTLGVTYLGTAVADYRIEGTLTGASRGTIALARSPVFTVDGGPVTEFFTGDDLLDWDVRVTEGSAEDAWRSGIIPDDDYEICVRLVTPDGIQLDESCASFLVELPEAPELLFPSDGDGVSVFQPTFQWTPVMLREQLGIDYRVTIVELYPGQNPVSAIDANLPVFDETVGEAPLLVYPIDAVSLEAGREYVWRVEVLDGFGDPLVPGGLLSPPQRFTTAETDAFGRRLGEDGALPETLPLVPGLATLTDLGGVDVEPTPDGWLLNGQAWLDLEGPYGVRGRVRLEDLLLDDYGGLVSPTEGRVVAQLETALPVETDVPVTIRNLVYTPEEGLTATASLDLPGGTFPLEGDLQVTLGGLFGTLRAGTSGEVLTGQGIWRGGSDPLELWLHHAEVTFPGGSVVAEGSAHVLGGRAVCEGLSATVSGDGVWTVNPLCLAEADAETAAVDVGLVSGTVSANLETGEVTYDLEAQGSIPVAPSEGICRLRITLAVSSSSGVEAADTAGRCDAGQARLDAGWIRFDLSRLTLESLSYTPGVGFDLAATVDLAASLPDLPELRLPAMEGVRIDDAGIEIPAATLSLAQPTTDLAGYGLSATEVTVSGARIAWVDWRAARMEAVEIRLAAGLSLPGLGSASPACLIAALPAMDGGSIRDGRLSLDVSGATGLSADCEVELAPGVRLGLDGFAGPVEVGLDGEDAPGVDLVRGLGVTGSLRLSDPFLCQAGGAGVALDGALVIDPDGRIRGEAPTAVPTCPIPLGPLEIVLEPGRLLLDEESATQRALLEAEVSVRETASGDPLQASGSLVMNLGSGRIVDGEASVVGPLPLGVPTADPVFAFDLDGITLSAAGLGVDGRHRLAFATGPEMGVTFDRVRLSLADGTITSGSVYFDTELGLEGGVDDQGAVSWEAVSSEAPLELQSGFRVQLPAEVALDSAGLGVTGEGDAFLTWNERVFGSGADAQETAPEDEPGATESSSLTAAFRDGFRLDLSTAAVGQGFVAFEAQGSRIAWVDAAGFHPDYLSFGTALLPERLPLPSESVAYLELRDDQGSLRVQQEATAEGLRIFSDPQDPVPLVLPALDADGAGAPEVLVSVDVVLDERSGFQIRSGVIVGAVDPVLSPELDLTTAGIPFRIEELSYADSGDGYAWAVIGEPVVLGEPVPGGSAVLALGAPPSTGESPRLAGLVDIPWVSSVALLDGSDRLRFEHRRLTGGFDVGLQDGSGTWTLALEGDLLLDLDGQGGARLEAVLETSPSGVAFTSLAVDAQAPPVYFDAGVMDLAVSDLEIPVLTWDESAGWDFEIAFDLAFRFPGLDGLETATVPDLRLTPAGLALPELSFTRFDGGFELAGFQAAAVALRIPALSLDPFGAGIAAAPWSPSFDLTLSLGAAGEARWPELADLELGVLDAGWTAAGFTGAIEARSLLQPPTLDFGPSGFGLDLDRFGGSLEVQDGTQEVSILVGGEIRLPDRLRCPAGPDGLIAVSSTDLELFPGGGFGGRIENASLGCPLELGPLSVELTDADLVFGFVGDVQAVNLFADATLRLPGVVQGDTVSASGTLDVALLEPAVVGGSIAVSQPFRWDIPSEDPFLSFRVDQAVLDSRGFVLDGSGTALLDSGAMGPSVTFAGLTFDVDGRLSAGSATIQSGLGLEGALVGSTVDWSLADPSQPLAADAGFRLGLQGGATLSPAGLALTGGASAELAFGDSTFTALDVDFSQGFTLAALDARVSAGRADFDLNGTSVAYVTPQGFFPGDLFGVLPLPNRIPLPTEDVAYLQVRDPAGGQPLVETASGTDGLSLSTRGGETVDLVLPGLPDAAGDPTVVPVAFSIVVNPASHSLVSGALEAVSEDPGGVFDLAHLGVPLTVTRVAYDSGRPGGPVLDARLTLPASLSTADVRFRNLPVGAGGLGGEALLGSLDPAAGPNPPVVAQLSAGALDLRVDGARVRFGTTPEATLEGSFSSSFFRDPSGVSPEIAYTAGVSADGSLQLSADVSSLPNGRLPVGQALFELTGLGGAGPVSVTATDQELTLAFSGVLTLPGLAPEFALTVDGLSVGTNGVDVGGASTTLGSQQFSLFGADFDLRDTSNGPGLGLSLSGQVLLLEMNGDLDFYGRSVEFRGLRLGSDGRVEMASAALTTGGVDLVPEAVRLERLAIANSALRADLDVDLPAPFDGAGTQEVSFTVAADGTVAGGGVISLIDEAQGLGGGRTQVDGTLATAHLRYLGLRLQPGQSSPGSVEAVGDLYLAGDAGNRISLGSRANNSVDPGLVIDLDGGVRWGPVSLSRSFDFDFDMLELTVDNVTVASSSPDALSVGFGGELAVDVSVVTGGLGFSDFVVESDLSLTTDQASIQNGSLAIAGVIGLSLSRFEYSSTPTTLTGVRGGSYPSADASAGSATASASSESIPVSSVLRFGGSLSLGDCVSGNAGCMLSGGVEEFLFYKTPESEGALTRLVVQGANLDIPGFDLDADLRYAETDTRGGFELILGGSASFGPQDFGVVGAVESSDDVLRAGLFVLSATRIEIVPVLLALEGVGGGFFYNPRPEYCSLVRAVSGVGDYSQSGNSCDRPGKFSGYLFAEAVIVERTVARASALVSISERRFQLDGAVALLYPGGGDPADAPIGGTVNLTVGFEDLYVEGGVTLDLDYAPLISGRDGESLGELGFYIYGEDAWGVFGRLSVEIMTVMDGSIEVFVGPPGFYLEGSLRAGFDIVFLAVDAYANAALWAVSGSWGAYLNIGVSAEILEGAISASADLIGAVVGGKSLTGPTSGLLVYMSAELRGCVLGLCGSAAVSATWQNGSFEAEWGRDSRFEGILAESRAAKARFESAKADLIADMRATSLLAGIPLDDDELAAIYASIQESDAAVQRVFTAIGAEWSAYPDDMDAGAVAALAAAERFYLNRYFGLLFQGGSPRRTFFAPTLESYYQAVETGVQELNANRAAVDRKLQQALVEIEELEDVGTLLELGPSPVVEARFAAPVADTAQNGSLTLVSSPGFEVDEAAAADLESRLTQRQQAAAEYAREVGDRIRQVESGLAWVDYLMLDTTSTGPLGYARDYGDVIEKVEEQYTRHGDLLLRQQDWLRNASDSLVALRPDMERLLGLKSAVIIENTATPFQAMYALARVRADALDDLSGTTNLAQTVVANIANTQASLEGTTTAEDLAPIAESLAEDLWYDLGLVGMTHADSVAGVQFDSIRARADRELRQRWVEHARLTATIDRAMQARADLVGGLADLYGEYTRTFPDLQAVTSTLTLQDLALSPEQMSAVERYRELQATFSLFVRERALNAQLQVPSVDQVTVSSQNRGYMAEEVFDWSASHPSGIHEYLYNPFPAADAGFAGAFMLQSNGPSSHRRRWVLTPGRGSTSQTWTFRAGARGGAGYLGFGRTTYTTRFEGSGATGRGTTRTYNRDPDVTAPSRPRVILPDHGSVTDAFWTASNERISGVAWRSLDSQSGIAEFQYAVGAIGDTTLVRPWTSVGGRTEIELADLGLDPDGPVVETTTGSTSLTGQDSPLLQFQAETLDPTSLSVPGYRIFVRATNGEGLQSAVGVSAPIRVDLTPPAFPDTSRIRQPMVLAPLSLYFPLYGSPTGDPILDAAQPVCPVPSSTGVVAPLQLTFQTLEPQTPPSDMTFLLPEALDVGSGVSYYAWRIDVDATDRSSEVGWERTVGTPETLTVGPEFLSYGDSLTLSLAAVDGVGLASEALHYRFRVPDPTDPVGAGLCVSPGTSPRSIRMRVQSPGQDPETGVVAWDYRVRAEDGTVLRDFPAAPDSTALRQAQVISTPDLPVTDGMRVYGEIRLHNGHGRTTITASGPLEIQLSPPPPPTVERVVAAQSSTASRLTVEYRTGSGSDLTHHWILLDTGRGGVAARGTLPGTRGYARLEDLIVRAQSGGALPPGTYELVLYSESPSGLKSPDDTATVVIP